MAEILGAELEVVHNGGHLNKKAGFNKFPILLNLILKNLA